MWFKSLTMSTSLTRPSHNMAELHVLVHAAENTIAGEHLGMLNSAREKCLACLGQPELPALPSARLIPPCPRPWATRPFLLSSRWQLMRDWWGVDHSTCTAAPSQDRTHRATHSPPQTHSTPLQLLNCACSHTTCQDANSAKNPTGAG